LAPLLPRLAKSAGGAGQLAVLAILLSLIPVWIADRITSDPVSAGAARAEAGGEAGA
jgi:hypothetical protein